MPTAGCPAKGSSAAGVKMRIVPVIRIVHEHGLAQAELGGHGLAPLGRHLAAVEEHRQLVALRTVLAAEHAKEVEPGHAGTVRCQRPWTR